MTLRMRVVEAGARARYDRMVARMVETAAPKLMLLPTWDELEEDDRNAQIETAAGYLDAFLDCLTENADEWDHAAMDKFPKKDISDFGPRELVAVLRNPEGADE